MKITCNELPGVAISKMSRHEVEKRGFDKKNGQLGRAMKYDKYFLYHLRHWCFKATYGNNLLGIMLLAPKSPKSRKGEVLHLSFVHVIKEHRLKGVGSFLFFAAHSLARYYGYKSIYIEIDKELPDSEPYCKAMIKHIKDSKTGTVIDEKNIKKILTIK